MEAKRNDQTADSAPADLSSRPFGERLELPELLLASGSPRRAEILRTVGWPFKTHVVGVDETRAAGEDGKTYVERLALEKAAAVRSSSQLVLGADTVVVVDNEILGKPGDAQDAIRMLQSLSGRWHEVISGVALLHGPTSRSLVEHEITRVRFAPMSVAEIRWYVSTLEPMDKAGAYAIQGRGARFIEEIKGDYFNVVGLPVRLLYKLVQNLAVSDKL